MFQAEYNEKNGAILNEAISIKDLVQGGATFEINSEFDKTDDGDLFPELETGEVDGTEYYEPIASPWEKDFDKLKEMMIKLPHFNVYKKVAKQGHGNLKMPEKARVTLHYNAYWERETLAFDSTYMRGQPRVFNTGQREVLDGLEIAVLSMKEGEESQFIISHELLFGEMGCPPRIKPKATGLFIIHLLHFVQTGDENAIDTVNNEDRRNYSVVIPKIREVHMRGMDLFRQGHISNACKLFHKALNTLECCRLSNEQEQTEQLQLILRLYTNLAVCYNKLNLPKKACSMCNEINRISDIRKNCKALFQEGRALLKLGEFKPSRDRLMAALRLEPNNRDIVNELKLLDGNKCKYDRTEKQIWKRAFHNTDPEKETDEVDEQFSTAIKPLLNTFLENDKQRYIPLPDGLSGKEIAYIKALIKNMSIKLQMEEDRNNKCYYKLVKQT